MGWGFSYTLELLLHLRCVLSEEPLCRQLLQGGWTSENAVKHLL